MVSAITIRRLPPDIKAGLKARALRHRRSMEEEVRQILTEAVVADEGEPESICDIARELFGEEHGFTFERPRFRLRPPESESRSK